MKSKCTIALLESSFLRLGRLQIKKENSVITYFLYLRLKTSGRRSLISSSFKVSSRIHYAPGVPMTAVLSPPRTTFSGPSTCCWLISNQLPLLAPMLFNTKPNNWREIIRFTMCPIWPCKSTQIAYATICARQGCWISRSLSLVLAWAAWWQEACSWTPCELASERTSKASSSWLAHLKVPTRQRPSKRT